MSSVRLVARRKWKTGHGYENRQVEDSETIHTGCVRMYIYPSRDNQAECLRFSTKRVVYNAFFKLFAKSSSPPSPPTTKWALWVTKKRSFSWSSNSLLNYRSSNRYLTACLITHQSAGKHCFAKCWDETPVSVWKEDNRVAAHCLAHLLVYWSFCFAEQ